jgi:hypothetical protein
VQPYRLPETAVAPAGSAAVRQPSAAVDVVAAFTIIVLTLAFGVYWLTSLGLGLSAYLFVRFVREVGYDVPIDLLVLVLASLQWLVGPSLAYAGFSNHYKCYMYVPEDIYMPLAVPGVLALSIGVLLLQTRKWRSKRVAIVERAGEVVRSFRILPFYLVGVGIICSLLRTRAPGALGFVFYVMSNVLYIGVLYGIHAYRYSGPCSTTCCCGPP